MSLADLSDFQVRTDEEELILSSNERWEKEASHLSGNERALYQQHIRALAGVIRGHLITLSQTNMGAEELSKVALQSFHTLNTYNQKFLNQCQTYEFKKRQVMNEFDQTDDLIRNVTIGGITGGVIGGALGAGVELHRQTRVYTEANNALHRLTLAEEKYASVQHSLKKANAQYMNQLKKGNVVNLAKKSNLTKLTAEVTARKTAVQITQVVSDKLMHEAFHTSTKGVGRSTLTGALAGALSGTTAGIIFTVVTEVFDAKEAY